jgi:hypothetical protein
MSSVMRFDEWQDSNGVPVLNGAGGGLALGKILQVVSATDSTNRTTSSTSYADAGLSISITPLSSSSTLYLTWVGRITTTDGGGTTGTLEVSITDSSDVALVGAEEAKWVYREENGGGDGAGTMLTCTGVVASTDTSARTYKLRFKRAQGGTQTIQNASNTGRITVMEVAA